MPPKVPIRRLLHKSQAQPDAATQHGPSDSASVLSKVEARLAAIDERLVELPTRILETVPSLKPLLNVKDVAATLGVSERTVDTLAADGELPPIWIRGRRLWHPDVVAAFIRHRAGISRGESR